MHQYTYPSLRFTIISLEICKHRYPYSCSIRPPKQFSNLLPYTTRIGLYLGLYTRLNIHLFLHKHNIKTAFIQPHCIVQINPLLYNPSYYHYNP